MHHSGLTLPFCTKSLCIVLEKNHFQWLLVKSTDREGKPLTTWSECTNALLVDAARMNNNLDGKLLDCQNVRFLEGLPQGAGHGNNSRDLPATEGIKNDQPTTIGTVTKRKYNRSKIPRHCFQHPYCKYCIDVCKGRNREKCVYYSECGPLRNQLPLDDKGNLGDAFWEEKQRAQAQFDNKQKRIKYAKKAKLVEKSSKQKESQDTMEVAATLIGMSKSK